MDDATTVRALLDAAGLTPSPAEVDGLIQAYPRIRQMADLLHAVEEARYEAPGLHFDPEPRHVDWW